MFYLCPAGLSHSPCLICPFVYISVCLDLGVIFDSELSFRDHIQLKINKAYRILGLIKRNFIHMDKNTFIMLYKSLVRPYLEYANFVWSPYKKGDVEAIEKVQKRATKLVISLSDVYVNTSDVVLVLIQNRLRIDY